MDSHFGSLSVFQDVSAARQPHRSQRDTDQDKQRLTHVSQRPAQKEHTYSKAWKESGTGPPIEKKKKKKRRRRRKCAEYDGFGLWKLKDGDVERAADFLKEGYASLEPSADSNALTMALLRSLYESRPAAIQAAASASTQPGKKRIWIFKCGFSLC